MQNDSKAFKYIYVDIKLKTKNTLKSLFLRFKYIYVDIKHVSQVIQQSASTFKYIYVDIKP